MTRTKAGRAKREKAFFEGVCTFIPGLGEMVLTYDTIDDEYSLWSESEWAAIGPSGGAVHPRYTADWKGRIFDNGEQTKLRMSRRTMRKAW